MEEYRQNAINYVKENVECVGYRDYIVEQLEVPAVLLDRIRKLKYDIGLDKNYTFHGCINKRRVYELIDNMLKEYGDGAEAD